MDTWWGVWQVVSLLANSSSLLVSVGAYLLLSFAMVSVFRKTGSAEWKAWVPIVREWELFRLAGMAPAWAVIIPVGTIFIVVFLTIILLLGIFGAIEGGTSGNVGLSVGLGIGGVFLYILAMFAWIVFTIIVTARMVHRMNRAFGQSAGMTVLGILVFPAWAAVLGWGSAVWGGERSTPGYTLRFPDGSQVPIHANRVVIGTSPSRDGLPLHTQLVTVADQAGTVAPMHAQLDQLHTGWMLTDLNTVTGTSVWSGEGHLVRLVTPATGFTVFYVGGVRVELCHE